MAPTKAALQSKGEKLHYSVAEHNESAVSDECDGLSDVSETPPPSADGVARPQSAISDRALRSNEDASDSDVDVEGFSPLVAGPLEETRLGDRRSQPTDEIEQVSTVAAVADFEPAAFNGLVDSIKLAQSQREIVDMLLNSRLPHQQQYQPQLSQQQQHHQHYAAAVAAAAAAAEFVDAVSKTSAAAAVAVGSSSIGNAGNGYIYAPQLSLLPQSNCQQHQQPHTHAHPLQHQQRMQAAAAAAAAAAVAAAATHGKVSPFSAGAAPHFLPASPPPQPTAQQQPPPLPPHRPDLLRSLSLPPIGPCLVQLDGKPASYPATPLGFVAGNGVFKLALPSLDFPMPPGNAPISQSQPSTPNTQTSPLLSLGCYHPGFAAQCGQQQQSQQTLSSVCQLTATISRGASAAACSRQQHQLHQLSQIQQQQQQQQQQQRQQQQQAMMQHLSLKRPSTSAPAAPKRRKRGGVSNAGTLVTAKAAAQSVTQELPELLDQEEIKLFQRVASELFVWHAGQKPMIHLFLLKLLDNSRCHNNIEWVDKENRLFKVITPSTIAKLWKHIKGNKTDNYECFARGIRHSRDIGRYFEPHEFRKKKIYKFSVKAIEDYQSTLQAAMGGGGPAGSGSRSAEEMVATASAHYEAAVAPGPQLAASVKLEERGQSPTDGGGYASPAAVEELPASNGDDEKRQVFVAPSGGHAMPNPEVLERLKNKLAERRQSHGVSSGSNCGVGSNEIVNASSVDWNCGFGLRGSLGSSANCASADCVNSISNFSCGSSVTSSSENFGCEVEVQVEVVPTFYGSSGVVSSSVVDCQPVKPEKANCAIVALSVAVDSEGESTDSVASTEVPDGCGRRSADSVKSAVAESTVSNESAAEEAALVIATCVT